jgi:hypothetical protein
MTTRIDVPTRPDTEIATNGSLFEGVVTIAISRPRDPLGYDFRRVLKGERDVAKGRYRPVSEALEDIRKHLGD